jgi:hypothetical protein
VSARLEVQLDRDGYAQGDSVHGWVRVAEGGGSRRLEVSLQYLEKVPDYAGCALRVGPVSLHEGDLQAGQAYEFNLQLPADAPPAFTSLIGHMHWAVVARSDQFGPDKFAAAPIDVSVPSSG